MPGVETTSAGAADLHNRRLVHLTHQTTLVDYTGGPIVDGHQQPVYVGWAEPNTPTATPLWRVARFTYNGDGLLTAIEWAARTLAYVTAWDNRATAAYG